MTCPNNKNGCHHTDTVDAKGFFHCIDCGEPLIPKPSGNYMSDATFMVLFISTIVFILAALILR